MGVSATNDKGLDGEDPIAKDTLQSLAELPELINRLPSLFKNLEIA